eukprot:689004-Rhodomonas_salina.1
MTQRGRRMWHTAMSSGSRDHLPRSNAIRAGSVHFVGCAFDFAQAACPDQTQYTPAQYAL